MAKLTLIQEFPKNDKGIVYAQYLCSCGNIKSIRKYNVDKGLTVSCGCAWNDTSKKMIESSKTHGLSGHPLYKVWASMLQRCYYKNNINYCRYGGVGVEVCEEWRNDFKCFYEWAIENGWKKGLQIDKDINGNGKLYSPKTCKIVSVKENNSYQKTNIKILYKQGVYTLSKISEMVGISRNLLYSRMRKGMNIEDAISFNKYKII